MRTVQALRESSPEEGTHSLTPLGAERERKRGEASEVLLSEGPGDLRQETHESPWALFKSRAEREIHGPCAEGCFPEGTTGQVCGHRGARGSRGVGGRACGNLNFQTHGGGAARASQTQTESFSLNFMCFGCYPAALSLSSVRLRYIFVIPESGPLLCGLDRQTDGRAWAARGGEGTPPPS